jgi:hypothetical protein
MESISLLHDLATKQLILTVKVARRIILNKNGEMKSYVKSKFDEIMQMSKTQITCVGHTSSALTELMPSQSSDFLEIEIMGSGDLVELARLRCLVLLDELVCTYSAPLESIFR